MTPVLTARLTSSVQFSSVQFSHSVVSYSLRPHEFAACQASLSITNSRSSLKLTSIKSVMPSSHLILCHPLLLLPPIPPSIRVFSNESTLPGNTFRFHRVKAQFHKTSPPYLRYQLQAHLSPGLLTNWL